MSTETSWTKSRRKLKNILIAPKAQFRTAITIFIVGFLFISAVFGITLYQLHDLINTLVDLAGNSEEASMATRHMGAVLISTYIFLLLSFLCSTLFLAITITHRYLGPAVAIRRHIHRLIEGNYEQPLRLRKNDQFKDLAEDLNRLTEKLKSSAR